MVHRQHREAKENQPKHGRPSAQKMSSSDKEQKGHTENHRKPRTYETNIWDRLIKRKQEMMDGCNDKREQSNEWFWSEDQRCSSHVPIASNISNRGYPKHQVQHQCK